MSSRSGGGHPGSETCLGARAIGRDTRAATADLIEGDGGTFAPEGAPADDRDTAPPAVAPAVDVDPPALRPLGRDEA